MGQENININPIPKDGSYRVLRPKVEKTSKELAENLFGDSVLQNIFCLTQEGLEQLTEQERADIAAYVRFAAKRIVWHSAHSSINAHYVEGASSDEERIERGTDRSIFAHDIIHSWVAYGRHQSQNSMTPEFLKGDQIYAQTNPDALREELMVALWEGGSNDNIFLRLARGTPFRTMLEGVAGDLGIPSGDAQKLLELEQVIRSERLEGTDNPDHAGYCLDMHELYHFFLIRNFSDFKEGMDDVLDEIRRNRFPIFEESARRIYEHRSDPKVLVHEFQKLTAPLLGRLRIKARERQGR